MLIFRGASFKGHPNLSYGSTGLARGSYQVRVQYFDLGGRHHRIYVPLSFGVWLFWSEYLRISFLTLLFLQDGPIRSIPYSVDAPSITSR